MNLIINIVFGVIMGIAMGLVVSFFALKIKKKRLEKKAVKKIMEQDYTYKNGTEKIDLKAQVTKNLIVKPKENGSRNNRKSRNKKH